MACFIGSNNERFYVALESQYGTAAAANAAARCGGIRLDVRQDSPVGKRRDKTGSRTFAGAPARRKTKTEYRFESYLLGGSQAGGAPQHGPLFEAALGAAPLVFGGATVASVSGKNVTTNAAHGLSPGQAVAAGGEIRVAVALPSATSMVLNAAFSEGVGPGTPLSPATTYLPSGTLKSVTLHDRWSPDTAVQRILAGAAVEQLDLRIGEDFHEARFAGPAAALIDNVSFENGQGGLSEFPVEPALEDLDADPIPAHLGQIWLGTGPARLYNVVEAQVSVKNNIDTRQREFGSTAPRCLVPGMREVTFSFSLYEQDNAATLALYQAAKQQTPVSAFLQFGDEPGRMCGVWLPSFVPEVPEFDDGEPRLQWKFRAGRAEGTVDDEITLAFA